MTPKVVKYLIKNNKTGAERIKSCDLDWFEGDEGNSLFWWTEGNMGCDCNRALAFARAADEDEPKNPSCGDTGFSIPWLELSDGRKILIDEA